MHNASCADGVRVCDPLLRLFHWSLVLAFAIACLSGDEWMSLHRLAGYFIGGLLLFRLLWGLLGPQHARFTDFVRPPGEVCAYLLDLVRGKARPHEGHNPAGGAMVVLLLSILLLLMASGLAADVLGGALFEGLHELLANLAILLVGMHIAGVLIMSLMQRANLARAMITGCKQARNRSGEGLA